MSLSETFGFEERWIRLCLKALSSDASLFRAEEIPHTQALLGGLGNRQVLAVRDWVRGSGLAVALGNGDYGLSRVGRILLRYDPGLEEHGAIWAIHHGLCMRPGDIWFYAHYVNEFPSGQFTRDDIKSSFLAAKGGSEKYIDSKCVAPLLHTMKATRLGDIFGLLVGGNGQEYERRSPELAILPGSVVAYMLLDWASRNQRSTVHLGELLLPGSVGRHLGVEVDRVNQYLDMIQERYSGRVLAVSRTAGLNSITISRGLPADAMLVCYYRELCEGLEPTLALQDAISSLHDFGETSA